MIYVERPCVKLVACRANAGMNQDEFAKALGVSSATVYNWERGASQPGLPELMKISELSSVPLSLIFIPEKS